MPYWTGAAGQWHQLFHSQQISALAEVVGCLPTCRCDDSNFGGGQIDMLAKRAARIFWFHLEVASSGHGGAPKIFWFHLELAPLGYSGALVGHCGLLPVCLVVPGCQARPESSGRVRGGLSGSQGLLRCALGGTMFTNGGTRALEETVQLFTRDI